MVGGGGDVCDLCLIGRLGWGRKNLLRILSRTEGTYKPLRSKHQSVLTLSVSERITIPCQHTAENQNMAAGQP